jgi:hypothetical protein
MTRSPRTQQGPTFGPVDDHPATVLRVGVSLHPVGIDAPGTVLFAATLTALLVPLTEGRS